MRIDRLTDHEVARFRDIRLRGLHDAPWAFGTTVEVAASWAQDDWSRLLQGLVAFVAVDGGADVGLIRCAADRSTADAARIGSLWVAPRARGTGVGAALVEQALEWARTQGFARVILDVSDDNEPAIALYRLQGFEPTGGVGTLPPPRAHLGKHERVRVLRSE